ncbi:MAG: hypothetical protein JKY60_15885 [Kordiimonadaceae bacterium]|nr:hypothetical protein [Kordiimonadaceae bacterium]
MSDISLVRLNLLRGCYLLLAIGLGVQVFPRLISVTAAYPFYEGVVDVMLGALAITSIIGLFAPIKMLPLLLFEIIWKVLWFVAVLITRWRGGTLDERMVANIFPIALVVPFIVVFPWGYAVRELRNNTDRWQ